MQSFATQNEIREAAKAEEDAELHRWVALGLMPDPRRRGANRNRWPPWAVERARWIREQLEQDDATAEPAPAPVRIELDSFDLDVAVRRLCEEALERAGSLVGAAALLGITRHALRRLMVKLRLDGPQPRPE